MFFVLFGLAVGYSGWRAIVERHSESEWRYNAPVGAGAGWRVLDGAEAVEYGIGILALGAMVAVWGIGLVAAAVRAETKMEMSPLSRNLARVSLVLLAVVIFCEFPPWTLRGISLLVIFAIVLKYNLLPDGAIPRKYRQNFLPALLLLVVLGGWLHRQIGAGMAVGACVAFVVLVHRCVLDPEFQRRWLESGSVRRRISRKDD